MSLSLRLLSKQANDGKKLIWTELLRITMWWSHTKYEQFNYYNKNLIEKLFFLFVTASNKLVCKGSRFELLRSDLWNLFVFAVELSGNFWDFFPA